MIKNDTSIQLWECAAEVRRFLENIWTRWHEARGYIPAIQSIGTCGRSSVFLKRVYFKGLHIEAVWATDSKNCGASQSGFYANGKWNNHS